MVSNYFNLGAQSANPNDASNSNNDIYLSYPELHQAHVETDKF